MKFEPHEYQQYAIRYIESHPTAAVLLDMGLGKTVITLTAIQDLLFDSFNVHRVLVVCPLRVRAVWANEIQHWDHLHRLKYTVAVGTEAERLSALKAQVDIYIINRENVQWLIEKSGIPFDFDMVVVDELSSFKNYQSKRFKALMKARSKVKRIVGLTGTPSSNGLMDLWAEFRLLDMGKRLGRFITHYREAFFLPDRRSAQQVFTWKPKPGAEDEIYRHIIMAGQGFKDSDDQAPLYLRTTEEMLEEFEYLGSDRAEEVVITNTRKIADMCEKISPVRPDKCPPVIENSDETLRSICYNRAHEMYGDNLPQIVVERLEQELNFIISNVLAVMYFFAQ